MGGWPDPTSVDAPGANVAQPRPGLPDAGPHPDGRQWYRRPFGLIFCQAAERCPHRFGHVRPSQLNGCPRNRQRVAASLTRQALGLQTTPPNQVIAGLALILSLFIMTPTLTQMNKDALQPYLKGQVTITQGVQLAEVPLKTWMLKQTGTSELSLTTAAIGPTTSTTTAGSGASTPSTTPAAGSASTAVTTPAGGASASSTTAVAGRASPTVTAPGARQSVDWR